MVTGAGESVEIPLRLVRAELEAGDAAAALNRLAALDAELEFDWRPVWYRAQAALLTGDYFAAAADFESVYAALPGEPAPKLALAAALELGAEAGGSENPSRSAVRGALRHGLADRPRLPVRRLRRRATASYQR